jgi:hypothetical protein
LDLDHFAEINGLAAQCFAAKLFGENPPLGSALRAPLKVPAFPAPATLTRAGCESAPKWTPLLISA